MVEHGPRSVPPGVVNKLLEVGTRQRLMPSTPVFHAGERPTAVYLVEDGCVRVDRTTPSGRQVLLTLCRTGELVGELAVIDRDTRSASCTVVTSTRLLVVAERQWNRLLDSDAELASWVTRRVVRRLRGLTDQFVAVAVLDARERIAARLCDLLDMGFALDHENIVINMPVSQQDLAHWAGLSREGAVKGIRQLRESGVIETARKVVRVLDEPALRRLASEALL